MITRREWSGDLGDPPSLLRESRDLVTSPRSGVSTVILHRVEDLITLLMVLSELALELRSRVLVNNS